MKCLCATLLLTVAGCLLARCVASRDGTGRGWLPPALGVFLVGFVLCALRTRVANMGSSAAQTRPCPQDTGSALDLCAGYQAQKRPAEGFQESDAATRSLKLSQAIFRRRRQQMDFEETFSARKFNENRAMLEVHGGTCSTVSIVIGD